MAIEDRFLLWWFWYRQSENVVSSHNEVEQVGYLLGAEWVIVEADLKNNNRHAWDFAQMVCLLYLMSNTMV